MEEDPDREAALCRSAGGPGLIALAGLWENWRSPAGEWIRTFAVVTCPPNELCAELRKRMPVVLGRWWKYWLTGRVAAAVEKVIAVEDLGSLALKGLTQPVSAFNVPLAVTPPALRVIEGGPQNV